MELAEEVLKQVSGCSKLVYLPLPQDYPKQRKPNIILTQSELDWYPSGGPSDALVDIIAYLKSARALRP
jgi:nucleoside-diphosphate-sugar epimerase